MLNALLVGSVFKLTVSGMYAWGGIGSMIGAGGFVVGGLVSSVLVIRLGAANTMFFGTCVASGGYLLAFFLSYGTIVPFIVLLTGVSGVGVGIVMPPLSTLVAVGAEGRREV
jgi:Na+/melibiose symporter-like transporter